MTATSTCEHLQAPAPHVTPDPPGKDACVDCLREGTGWVHLRLCTGCGHVGCCDSSPQTHATKHFHATRHPVVASAEPGEHWRWCYVDEQMAAG